MKKLLISLLLISPIAVFAQAFQLNLQGTRQIGKASTGIAQPTDATSLFTNPGSAAFNDSNDVTIGITPVISNGTFTDANTNVESKTDNPIVTPFNASVLLGNKDGKWRYGLTVYTPFGSTMDWEDGSTLRFAIDEIELLSVSVQPTVSYKITDKLGIGVGLIYTYGHIEIEKDLPVQYGNGDFGESEVEADANGFGVNAGLYYEATDQLSLGLTYRSGINMKTSSGTVEFDVPASLKPNFKSQDIDAELPLPQIFGLGLSYRPTEHWVINLEGYLSDWSKYDTIRINFNEEPVAGENSSEMIRNYKTGYSFRLGVEYLAEKFELRAGAIYGISPIQDGYVSPDVPDADRISPSVGVSYIVSNAFRIDAAFLAEFIHRKDKNIINGIDGTYDFDLFIPSLGLSYRF